MAEKHGGLLQSWGIQWDSMTNDLSTTWGNGAGFPFMDMALSLILVFKQNKQAWKRASAALHETLLQELFKSLADVVHIVVFSNIGNYLNIPIPSHVF